MLLSADGLQLQLLHLLLQLLLQVHLLLLVVLHEQTGLDVVQGKQVGRVAAGGATATGSRTCRGHWYPTYRSRFTAYGRSRGGHQQRVRCLCRVTESGTGPGAGARARYPRDFNVVGQVLVLLAQELRLVYVVNGYLRETGETLQCDIVT